MQQEPFTMDFQQLASRWQRFSLLKQDKVLSHPLPLQDDWLDCCRAWISGGPSPDDHPEIREIIRRLHPLADRVARAYIECARLFRLNRRGTSGTVEWSDMDSLRAELPSPHLPLAFLL